MGKVVKPANSVEEAKLDLMRLRFRRVLGEEVAPCSLKQARAKVRAAVIANNQEKKDA